MSGRSGRSDRLKTPRHGGHGHGVEVLTTGEYKANIDQESPLLGRKKGRREERTDDIVRGLEAGFVFDVRQAESRAKNGLETMPCAWLCNVKANVQISSLSEPPATRRIAGKPRCVSRTVQRCTARAA